MEGEARAIAMDVLDPAAVGRAMAFIGALDHLVVTAVGDEYALFGRITDLSSEQLERSLDKLRGLDSCLSWRCSIGVIL